MTDQKPTRSQLDKFKEAAREMETDNREEAFDERLKKIGKRKRDPNLIGKRISPSD